MNKFFILAFALILALTLGSCQQQSQDVSQVPTERAPAPVNNGYQNISPEKAVEMLKDGVRLVDVRTVDEYESGHIPGAESAPLDSLSTSSGSWDKNKPVAVICLSGGRSAVAANQLVGRGFTKVYDVSGGMMAYKGEKKIGSDK